MNPHIPEDLTSLFDSPSTVMHTMHRAIPKTMMMTTKTKTTRRSKTKRRPHRSCGSLIPTKT